jgi:hypothetical protein
MKALTICQPYAHLIVRGEKRVENREWTTRYRGPLVIHAGKSREWLAPECLHEYAAEGDPLVFGAAIGVADLIDCLHINRIVAGEYDARHIWLSEHDHTHGTWCLVLSSVRRFDPIPWKGAQGLWDFPDSALAAALKGGAK